MKKRNSYYDVICNEITAYTKLIAELYTGIAMKQKDAKLRVSDENEKEFFGWCVLDKYGVSRHVIPARQHFFGCIDIKEAIDEPDEVLKEFDRDCAGLAPHKICKLYIGV